MVQAEREQTASETTVKMNLKDDPSGTPGWERATLEKLAFASLNEQKATRRWKTFVRMAWLAF
ncbi:MAG: S49 family peptidase, partial [Pseudomonadota bacterium]